MENESKLLDNIERYVFEENKIVTYKWLSRQHNIHVNIAKRLLSSFIDKTNEKLSVCCLIGGLLSDGSHKVVVGWQQELSSIKQGFTSVTSEHIYSVKKEVENGDLKALLYSADCSSAEENLTEHNNSSIKCDECVLRNTSALAEQKKQALIAKSKSVEVTKTNNVNGKKQPNVPEKENAGKSIINNETPATNGSKKVQTNSPKKAGIAAMFAAQKDTKKPENKEKIVQPPGKNKPKGLNAFFNQNNVNKNDSKVNAVVVKDASSPVCKEDKTSDHKEIEKSPEKSKDDSLEAKNNTSKDNNKKSKISVKKGGSKRKKSKTDDLSAKKRKRIVTLSDSESEEEGYRSPSPEIREPTPPPPMSDDEDVVPATPQACKNSKKKKLVEKTFMDDDGFLVSEKEYKLVSDSEEESVVAEVATEKSSKIEKSVKPEVKVKIQEPKKKNSPQKSKQSSITNFFKKS